MKRHEMWRGQYRSRRYIEHLTDDEVRQRAKDVFLNMLVITEEAKIGLPPINPESTCWMILWTHVLEEFVIRFGPLLCRGTELRRESLLRPRSSPKTPKNT